tara:strand:+ start:288 stop:479 length:192 start_codon:yes stop_codon:yes gene_type:complete
MMFVKIITRELWIELATYNEFCGFCLAEKEILSAPAADTEQNRDQWLGAKRNQLQVGIESARG